MSKRLAVHRLVEEVSPIPSNWVSEKGVGLEIGLLYEKRDGLWWPRGRDEWTEWAKRCAASEGRHLPWAMWAALRALGADTLPADPEGQAHELIARKGMEGAFLVADGYRVTFRRTRTTDLLVRLGWQDSRVVLTPGLTLEEKAAKIGFQIFQKRKPTQGKLDALGSGGRHGREAMGLPGLLEEKEEPEVWWGEELEQAGERVPKFYFGNEAGFDEEGDEPGEYELVLSRPKRGPLSALLDLEAEESRRRLAADPVLGLAAILGPLAKASTHSTLARRQATGYIGEHGELTKAGWWRLAYEAKSGVGMLDRFRQQRLLSIIELGLVRQTQEAQKAVLVAAGEKKLWRMTPDRRRHLRLAQSWCIRLMESAQKEGKSCIPIGVEYSAMGYYIAKEFHRYRADALLVGPDGELIWLEIMRRKLSRLGERTRMKYELMEKDCLPLVADRLERPVRYVLVAPGEVTERWFYPEAEPAF